jgi:hypothetical protein
MNVFLGALTFLTAKLTFFIMYLQIFKPMRWLRICVYVGGGLTMAFHVAIIIVNLYYMAPRPGETWLSHYTGPLPPKATVVGIPLAVVGFAIDIYLLVLPIAAIIQLQLSTKRKVWTILIFMTGILFEPSPLSLGRWLAEFRAGPVLHRCSVSVIESFSFGRPIRLGIA